MKVNGGSRENLQIRMIQQPIDDQVKARKTVDDGEEQKCPGNLHQGRGTSGVRDDPEEHTNWRNEMGE